MMRQRRDKPGGNLPHIDINALCQAMCVIRDWPHNLEDIDGNQTLVSAYFLCGADFIATLHSLTAAKVVEAYHSSVIDPSNAPFVKK